ncbi:MAG: hypothetical protein DRP84_12450 [Spirochaetes bacterium]|nr:MAG: hypothetical protein DRP84_12450 [Spirochaetota bacterium]
MTRKETYDIIFLELRSYVNFKRRKERRREVKKILRLLILTGAVVGLISLSAFEVQAQRKATFPFYIYKDKLSRGNHYCPSGWMGDYSAIRLNDNCKEDPYKGKTCMKWTYSGEATEGASWAGVFWQNPPNNWGKIKGGYDLTGAKKLTFWARGEKGGEIVEFKVGGITGDYSDTTEVTTGPISLTKDWKQYTIDLSDEDLSYISGGFCWVASALDVPEGGITFYLDEIVYEK